MSSLSQFFGGSGGGTPLNYTEATQGMQLEVNTMYIIPASVTALTLPDSSTVSIGDVIALTVAPNKSTTTAISGYNTTSDTIIYNDVLYGFWGAAAGNATATFNILNEEVKLYWDGVYWTELPTTSTTDTALPSSTESLIFTSSSTFTVPAFAGNQISFTVVGAGASGNFADSAGAGGGGGGAAIFKEVVNVTAGDVFTIIVGAGANPINSGASIAGGDSKVNDGTNDILIAGGGGAGSDGADSGIGGAGGTVSGTITPTTSVNGGAGGSGSGSGGSVTNPVTSVTYGGGSGGTNGSKSNGGGGASAFAGGGSAYGTSAYNWGGGGAGYTGVGSHDTSYPYGCQKGGDGVVIIYWGSLL